MNACMENAGESSGINCLQSEVKSGQNKRLQYVHWFEASKTRVVILLQYKVLTKLSV